MHDVRTVANAILDISDLNGLEVSNMSLNKLAFFSHGWFLALYDQPLVGSSFEAWQYGPVHPTLYHQFKCFGNRRILSRATKVDVFTGDDVICGVDLDQIVADHIRKIVEFYGGMKAEKLSSISHEEGAPWDQVWSKSGAVLGMAIPDGVTKAYYIQKLKRAS